MRLREVCEFNLKVQNLGNQIYENFVFCASFFAKLCRGSVKFDQLSAVCLFSSAAEVV